MRKKIKFSSKNNVRGYLLKNYVIIIIFVVLTYVMTPKISNLFLYSIYGNRADWNHIEPNEVLEYPYDNIDIKNLEGIYGWVEIVDENKDVIFVKGKKLDSIYHYNERFLYQNSAVFHDDFRDCPYLYNIYPVKGPHGEDYLYIIKLPSEYFNIAVTLKLFCKPEEISNLHIVGSLTAFGTFLILLFVSLFLYSRITSRHIINPLKDLRDAIINMKKCNYKVRLNFKAEKEIAEIRDEFNDMAEKLENIQLEKEEVQKSKNQLLTDIAHDLKTPITSILGFSKLLYDGKAENEMDKNRYLKYIYDKSAYVDNLINDLFQLSKLHNKEFEFKYEKNDFAEWLRQLISEFYAEFEEKNFNLVVDISEVPIMISFDKKEMTRAFTNLLSNALKYNPKGTSVYVYCYNENDKIIVKISDNGIGIDEKIKENIFNPFVLGDEARWIREGTGLGLAITNKIIERHNGKITLSSDDKAKTTFTIELPFQ